MPLDGYNTPSRSYDVTKRFSLGCGWRDVQSEGHRSVIDEFDLHIAPNRPVSTGECRVRTFSTK